MKIGSAGYLVGYHRYAPHDTADGFRPFYRIGNTPKHQRGFEFYKVGLVFFYIFFKVFGSMLTCKTVRVFVIRQQQGLDIHTLCQQHVSTSHGGMDTGLIAVVEQNDVGCETVQQSDLVYTQCRTRIGYHILQSALMHGYDIGITLHHIYILIFIKVLILLYSKALLMTLHLLKVIK